MCLCCKARTVGGKGSDISGAGKSLINNPDNSNFLLLVVQVSHSLTILIIQLPLISGAGKSLINNPDNSNFLLLVVQVSYSLTILIIATSSY